MASLEGCRERGRDRGMKYAGVKRRGRREGRRKREGERPSGWYHVLNQTKRNVLGLHEGWSVTRAELRGRNGRREIGWWWYGGGPRKGMMLLSPELPSFPQRPRGLETKKKVDARKGKRRWDDVGGWRKKSRESFGGVSRHVVELLFGWMEAWNEYETRHVSRAFT